MKTPLSGIIALLTFAAMARAAAPLALEESVLIEAVGDVWKIPQPTGREERAAKRDHLRAPDRLRTDRQSRAELEAPDGTITRLGANTLFAFDRATRSLKLERGSLLFHSPTGKGGGTIASPSASASVLGTTLVVAATPDGGFKLLVLEGRAQVDFTQGARLQLDAGQMTFVRPAAGGIGAPGPVVNFDLAQQVKSSRLVQGFGRPLPSQGKIDQAVEAQRRAVGQGQYTATGFLVFTATSDTQVNGIEAGGADADDNLKGDFYAPHRLALSTDVTLSAPVPPAERLFREPLLVPATESPFLNKESDVLVTGILGRNVRVDTRTLTLTGWGRTDFQIVGKQAVAFTGSTRFTGLEGVDYLRIFSPRIDVAPNSDLVASFPANSGRATTFYFDADRDLSFSGGSVVNSAGGLILQTHSGAMNLKGVTLQAGAAIGAATVVPSAINLDVRTGPLEMSGVKVKTEAGGFAALARSVTMTNSQFDMKGGFWTDGAETVRLDGLTFEGRYEGGSDGRSDGRSDGGAARGEVFQATAGDLASLRSVKLDAFREINLGARTLALESVNFPAGATVRLVSEQGRLAPQPNTGQAVQPGLVNFVRDVTYGGKPAQDFVPASVGGTGRLPATITISKPVPGT